MPAVGRHCRRDAVEPRREPRLGVQLVQVPAAVERRRQLVPASPERVRQAQQDAVNLFLLPFGQRDDVVVQVDRRERLEVEARAAAGVPWTMPGRRRGARRGRRRRTGRCGP